jgi:hypothetical protein
METTPIKMFKWKANDCGNNDCYDYYYANHMIFTIDEGESSLINEEQLTEIFIQKSMRVLEWKEEDNGEKLTWKLVKHKEGEYSIECCDVDYLDDWEGYASTLTTLDFTTENVFHLTSE